MSKSNFLMKEFEEVIKKHLPATTAGALKERLEEIDEIEYDRGENQKLLEQCQESLKKSEEKFDEVSRELEDLKKRFSDIEGREMVVQEKELKQELLQQSALHSARERDLAVNLFKTVFSNVVVTEEVLKNINKSHPDPNMSGSYYNVNDTETTTKTKRKDK